MNKIFLFLIILATCFTGQAQEYKYIAFPDSNAVWSTTIPGGQQDASNNYACIRIYCKYAIFNEDTVINNITYHKLYRNKNTSTITRENSVCIGGIREDSLKRVLVSSSVFNDSTLFLFYKDYSNYKEVVLYDFSKNIGDTIFTSEYGDSVIYNLIINDYAVITKIDTIVIDGTARKAFYVNNEHLKGQGFIEGVGGDFGLIFPWGPLCTCECSCCGALLCLHQNNSLIVSNSPDGCVPQFVIDGVEKLQNPRIKVFPNPALNGAVNFENIDFEMLEIFNATGTLVFRNSISGLKSYRLNTSGFQKGIYLYRLTSGKQKTTTGKIIIQ